MYILGLDGDSASSVTERVRRVMAERGPVGAVDVDGEAAEQTPPPTETVHARLDDAGTWQVTGRSGSLEALLDDLAPRCRYALVRGAIGDHWPTLRVDDEAVSGEFLGDAVAPDDLDPQRLVDALEQTEPWWTLPSLVAEAKRASQADRAGAIATFTGRVRAKDHPDDTPTEHLSFEGYGPVATDRMDDIRQALLEREGVYEVLLHHRTGVIPAGRDIVFVVVLAGHREEAFRTVEDGIDRLKADVPIFKKEVTVDEDFWVHTRP